MRLVSLRGPFALAPAPASQRMPRLGLHRVERGNHATQPRLDLLVRWSGIGNPT
jgi:hypothetical protein